MQRPPGSWIVDEEGNWLPNLDDEWMAEQDRLGLLPPYPFKMDVGGSEEVKDNG